MVPKTDAALATYSTNFLARASSAPEDFNLTAPQMADYAVLHDAFILSYNACRAEGARSKGLVARKEHDKAALLRFARQLYALVQASSEVSVRNKTEIGVKVRPTSPSPVPPPAQAPLLTLLSVTARAARYKLADATAPGARRRPPNALGAIILTHVGPTPPPVGAIGWSVHGATGRTTFLVEFPSDVPPGMACWVVARWYNRRGQYSPASEPVRTYLQVGPVRMAA
jgi:hypothetical protein